MQKSIITSYSPDAPVGRDKPCTVYCQECWWSDSWDPLDYGIVPDKNAQFFEQFKELQERVPRAALLNSNSENSAYTNLTANNKNCYLLFSNGYGHNEDCQYGTIKQPSAYSYRIKAEECTGDYIFRSSRCIACFDTTDTEQCKNLQYSVNHNKDVYDCSYTGGLELGLEIMGCVGGYNCIGCNIIWWDVANLSYSELMFNGAQDCFGCIGLRGKKFCILNKQYSEEEYKKLTAGIIERMKKAVEWGHFFPPSLSPFGYNESLAQDYFPLTKEQALTLGFNWNDRTPGTFGKGTLDAKDIPDAIADVSDDIFQKVLTCEKCQRNFKIVKQEFEFYKKLHIPIPRKCFDCRHLERLHKRRPRTLWHRQCMCDRAEHNHVGRCAIEFETTYSPPEGRASTPERPELVFCQECYQKEIV